MAPVFWENLPEIDKTEFCKVLATEGESVAKFRARLNISDIWIEWSFLTKYGKLVDLYHTLKLWEEHYCNWCIPLNIARTPVKNTRGESLSVFYLTNHKSDQLYIIEIKGVVHHNFSPKNHKGGLQLIDDNTIGSFFDRLKKQLDIYTYT